MLSGSLSSSSQEQKLESSAFDLICTAAIEENDDKLAQALKVACIDVWNEKLSGTPVTVLAKQGNIAAVNFLLKRHALSHYAACGYAQAGNFEELYKLI